MGIVQDILALSIEILLKKLEALDLNMLRFFMKHCFSGHGYTKLILSITTRALIIKLQSHTVGKLIKHHFTQKVE